jgi:uncharacterized protein
MHLPTKPWTIITLVIAWTLCFASPFWADIYSGKEVYKRGDYKTPLKEGRPLAEQGNTNAQFYLGALYGLSLGVPQNYLEAMKWLLKAAELGHSDARFNAGILYENGKGVPQDYKEALRWYRLPEEQGDAKAQTNLDTLSILGQGVP